MIEQVILKYLNGILSVEAFTEKPDKQIEEYVVIEKTGGHKENHICSATIAIQSYAKSLFRAAEINAEVIKAMDNLSSMDDIGASEYNTDYNFTDTSKKQYRYQAVYDIYY